MKKIFLTAGLIIMAAAVTFARNNTIDPNNHNDAKAESKKTNNEIRRKHAKEKTKYVSGFTKLQFANDFPYATNVEFVNADNFDEVYFTSGKKILKAFYDYSSNLVGTTENVTFTDLPENAQKKIQEKYAGFTVAGVVKFDDNESNETDMILYGAPFEDEDNYFVELQNAGKSKIVRVDLAGHVSFFKDLN